MSNLHISSEKASTVSLVTVPFEQFLRNLNSFFDKWLSFTLTVGGMEDDIELDEIV